MKNEAIRTLHKNIHNGDLQAGEDLSPVKTCKTCAHRSGAMWSSPKCMLSGYLCGTERNSPTVCGVDFKGWAPRLGVIKRIKMYWYGY